MKRFEGHIKDEGGREAKTHLNGFRFFLCVFVPWFACLSMNATGTDAERGRRSRLCPATAEEKSFTTSSKKEHDVKSNTAVAARRQGCCYLLFW